MCTDRVAVQIRVQLSVQALRATFTGRPTFKCVKQPVDGLLDQHPYPPGGGTLIAA